MSTTLNKVTTDQQKSPHTVSYDVVAETYNTNIEAGLSKVEAQKRLQDNGENKLSGDNGISPFKIILKQMTNAMILVLVLAMCLSYGVQDFVEGGVITAVIILNVVIGFLQEYRAEKTIDSLRSLSSPTASVLRDGNTEHIPSLHVVPGDIVELKTGDVVPADLRIVESMNFEVDESLLTGETLPVLKDPYVELKEDAGLGDRINLTYSSTTVTKGRARGIVIATGMETAVGNIAASINGKKRKENRSMSRKKYGRTQPIKGATLRTWDAVGKFLGLTEGTPLQRKLSKLAYCLLGCACILAIIVFAVNKFQDITHEVIIYAISLGIAIIPESLIAVLTITMSVGMRRMAKRNVLVRKLDALESLGGTNIICSDKTGTLTQGKMITRKVWIPDAGIYSVEEPGDASDPTSGYVTFNPGTSSTTTTNNEKDTEKSSTPDVTEELEAFLQSSALCNLANVRFDEEAKQWKATGDATEIALQVFANRFDHGKKTLVNKGWNQLGEFPFDSDVKRMSVVYTSPQAQETLIFTKGAIERVLDLCTTIGLGKNAKYMTDNVKTEVLNKMTELADQGLRVLAIASRVAKDNKGDWTNVDRNEVEQDLTLLGLAGLYDPPRNETKDAVRACGTAGIKVTMLTGDHASTARAIAKEISIIPREPGNLPAGVYEKMVMTATEFDKLSEEELDNLPVLPLVIARCTPDTKVNFINALHRRKMFAAMTGDGVNDSPSLRRADVGIGMGAGSDVAKSASDIVLSDDNFASIVNAVEEGRRMFENIQKFVLHLLASNVAEVILLCIGLAFQDIQGYSVFPLAPLAILWINMLTSSFPAFGLGLEQASPDIMRRPPHDTKTGIFAPEILADMMVMGGTMGACTISIFAIVVYAVGNDDLGINCNQRYSDSCETVFRARGAVFCSLTWLILISAWEIKSIRRSMFRLDPNSSSRFPFFRDMYSNKFLFYAVVLGFLSVFPAIYIPGLNTNVFKHKGITWELGLCFGSIVVFIVCVEAWKWVKRRFSLFQHVQTSDEKNAGLPFKQGVDNNKVNNLRRKHSSWSTSTGDKSIV